MSTINATNQPRAWFGIALALASAASYALANTSANIAYSGGSNALTVAATRFLVPSAALIIWLHLAGASPFLPRRDAVIAAALGVATAFYTWAILTSFSLIPFALAVLIFYLFPLFAAAIVVAFRWERFSWNTGAGILLAFAGLALALGVRGGNLDVTGVVLAFLAAAGLGVVVAVSSRLFAKHDARPLTLYMAAVASVVLLILCAAEGDFAWPHTQSGWIGFVASVAFYGFAMIAFFVALSMIGAMRASLLTYADAVISAVLGVVVLGQALTLVQVAGIALVIIALVGTTVMR